MTRRIGINRVLMRHTRVMLVLSGDRGAVVWSTDVPPRLGLVSGLRLVSGLLPTGSDRCCMFPWLALGHAGSCGPGFCGVWWCLGAVCGATPRQLFSSCLAAAGEAGEEGG